MRRVAGFVAEIFFKLVVDRNLQKENFCLGFFSKVFVCSTSTDSETKFDPPFLLHTFFRIHGSVLLTESDRIPPPKCKKKTIHSRILKMIYIFLPAKLTWLWFRDVLQSLVESIFRKAVFSLLQRFIIRCRWSSLITMGKGVLFFSSVFGHSDRHPRRRKRGRSNKKQQQQKKEKKRKQKQRSDRKKKRKRWTRRGNFEEKEKEREGAKAKGGARKRK